MPTGLQRLQPSTQDERKLILSQTGVRLPSCAGFELEEDPVCGVGPSSVSPSFMALC